MEFDEEKLLSSCDPSIHDEVSAGLKKLREFMEAASRGAEAEMSLSMSSCLATFEKALGTDHICLATILNVFAHAYRGQGKNDKAEALYKRSLEILERTNGHKHPDVARQLNNLAYVYTAEGKYSQVQAVSGRALSIWEQNCDEAPCQEICTSLMALAQCYVIQERHKEAELLYKRALSLCEASAGCDHPDVVTHLDNLAACYSGQRNYTNAEPLRQRALTILEKTLSPNDLAIAESAYTLSGDYFAQGKYDQAEPLLKRSLAIREQVLGLVHPQVVSTMESYITLLQRMNRDVEASQLQQRIKPKSILWLP